ncbi:baseplate multidomain protein megatron [Aquabacter spiritensis]|uniref:Putative tail protein n=1 Tax=Aquabacter spiritensis TaxID=933073 RepID=A0A4R3M8E1_9HYPH|nr:glycoside hydrolase/phage tail family protein [Aquabacter spiritensis]TCT07615.1 putative tail protein [Aquabacter spiritensis]
MATLLLGAAGSLAGGALFGPIGAVAGRALGALGGSMADGALFGGGRSRVSEGPRLSDLDVMTSNSGAPMPRLYGRARLAGQVIWATRLEEVVSTRVQASGGKGGRSSRATTTTISYAYYANFALGLCEGPVTRIGRIWADGKPLDETGFVVRRHLGTADQAADPWIAAKQGAAGTPAYRGLAYLVFERLPLAAFGNRVPQITAEVERAVGSLEPSVTAVTLIPGATEFGYDPRLVQRLLGPGSYGAENRHVVGADTDIAASLDQLFAACPNLKRVSLVVAWFGDDLRAGACAVRPKIDLAGKATYPYSWLVGGLPRHLAHETSRHAGRAAYGGTPADSSVVAAIGLLKARGIAVTLNPFVMMDIAPGNGRPDPWSDAGEQAAYPWRGRITCHPAPGRPGTPDGTAAADAEIAHLFGTAQASHFFVFAGLLLYAGPDEWTLRRMVLHYARLAVYAGGVEAVLIGSEMAALTRVRGAGGGFPAVAAFAALAADVKAVVGAGTKVSYAADWTEYGAQVFPDGTVRFPLDPLWSAPAVDFVGIDYYPPVTDWRDGPGHLDAQVARSLTDPAFLKARLRSGEAYDWYYPDAAARAAQARAPITDGASGEPWIYRQKDLWSWWSLPHHERPGGVRAAAPTGWVPGGKPIRLMEAGCPAVDKGPNRPSVFPDAKSAENGVPPFSNGRRDDAVQRRLLEAVIATFGAGADAADNPHAPAYGGRMVEAGCVFLWTWDARPYPQFPLATGVWADGANWQTGHWLNGRLGAAPLADLVAAICADHGVSGIAAGDLVGTIEGYVVDRPMSARDALEPLARAFAFDAAEAGGTLVFAPRGGGPVVALAEGDLALPEEGPALSLVRAQESELPLEIRLGFIDGAGDYRTASAASRRLVGASRHAERTDLSIVASAATMGRAADIWLQDLWAGRETARFALPPSRLALTPGDVVELEAGGRRRLFEITRIEEAEARAVSARAIEPDVFETPARPAEDGPIGLPPAFGPPELLALDLPLLEAAEPVPLLHLAAFAAPWPGTLAVWRSADGASFEAVAAIGAPATLGTLLDDLAPGPVWRFDRSTRLRVRLDGGLLSGAAEIQVLDGANALALVAEGRDPEVLQFTEAELLEPSVFRLSGLLRGQAGTEAAGAALWPAGTRLVALDRALAVGASGLSAYGRSFLFRVGRADRDHGDAMVVQATATVGKRALMPLSPVHLSARRTAEGIALAFVRRTRADADWDAVEAPLGEASEAYRVEILDGAAVRRSFDLATPALLYPAALEAADFGAPLTSLTVRVAQMSAALGPGAFRTATLPV